VDASVLETPKTSTRSGDNLPETEKITRSKKETIPQKPKDKVKEVKETKRKSNDDQEYDSDFKIKKKGLADTVLSNLIEQENMEEDEESNEFSQKTKEIFAAVRLKQVNQEKGEEENTMKDNDQNEDQPTKECLQLDESKSAEGTEQQERKEPK